MIIILILKISCTYIIKITSLDRKNREIDKYIECNKC